MTNLPVSAGTGTTDKTLQLVGFTVGSEEFAVDILKVQEIIRMVPVSAMPNAPDYVDGVINLRGRIIPIMDFRKRFHMPELTTAAEQGRRIVVVSLDSAMIGMVVDSVSQVLKLPESQISATPEVVRGYDSEAITGVGNLGDRLLILLDLEQMFSGRELSKAGTT